MANSPRQQHELAFHRRNIRRATSSSHVLPRITRHAKSIPLWQCDKQITARTPYLPVQQQSIVSHSGAVTANPASPSVHGSRFGGLEWLPFAITTFLGAFLVFQVQPIISKAVLPWFGGTPAVWTTCMLFFQLLLLGGYLYAHGMRTYLPLRVQALVHVCLLLLAASFLQVVPADAWKPLGDEIPSLYLLGLLIVHVGLPYFVLSSTGPLTQAWWSTRLSDKRVYRLYSLSNVGSLLALLSYPFLIEPLLSLDNQANLWGWLFTGFVAIQSALIGWLAYGKNANSLKRLPVAMLVTDEPDAKVSGRQRLQWIALTALASVLLLTTTNHVCQDVAVIPFLWVLPLSLYLITFIICFDQPKYYFPKLYAAIALGSLVALHLSTRLPGSIRLTVDAVSSITFFFFVCLLCHGEVARLKPSVKHLTQYYCWLATGGALGGFVVATLCPLILNDHSEQPIATTLGASLALVLFVVARNWTTRIYDWLKLGRLKAVAVILPLISVATAASYTLPGLIESDRNFFGVLRVERQQEDLCLVHGTTVHGVQRPAPYDTEPTAYYGHQSGIGRVLNSLAHKESIHLCGVGLGCGVLATYGRSSDHFEFIEINPAVVRIAKQHFTFLSDSSATISHHLGDGRLALEQLEHKRFDVLVLDAFSSDAIPAHLLTREAMQLYRNRLNEEGVIAVHVSNKYLDLAPLVHRLALDSQLTSKLVISPGDLKRRTLPAIWVIIAAPSNPIWKSERLKHLDAPEAGVLAEAPLWTDQHHNLLSVFRSP